MNSTTWWKSPDEVDADQRKLMMLPPDQSRYLLTGPPGSGKTNVLLLRAVYLIRSGFPNLKVVTFGRTLTEFIKSGAAVNRKIPPRQIDTHTNWQYALIRDLTGKQFEPSAKRLDFDVQRQELVRASIAAVQAAKIGDGYYDCLLVDEVQDLWRDELLLMARLTKRLFLAGDARQRIYDRNEGLSTAVGELKCVPHQLEKHYRIGRAICRAADRVLDEEGYSLETYCQYNETKFKSSVAAHQHASWDDQYSDLLGRLERQLRTYPEEWLGVIAPNRNALRWIAEKLESSRVKDKVKIHKTYEQKPDRSFDESRPICVMTAHSAKGTEFRSVHLFAAETLNRNVRHLGFTVFTRAKTSLDIYFTGTLRPEVEAAVAEERVPEFKEIFSD